MPKLITLLSRDFKGTQTSQEFFTEVKALDGDDRQYFADEYRKQGDEVTADHE